MKLVLKSLPHLQYPIDAGIKIRHPKFTNRDNVAPPLLWIVTVQDIDRIGQTIGPLKALARPLRTQKFASPGMTLQMPFLSFGRPVATLRLIGDPNQSISFHKQPEPRQIGPSNDLIRPLSTVGDKALGI